MKKAPDIQNFFADIKNILVAYLEARYELTKVSAYEKIAKITAVLFSGVMLTMFCFFTMLFVSLIGGFYFGRLLNNMLYGFSIIAALYFVAFVLLLLFRRTFIDRFIINAVIRVLFDENEETQDT